MMFKKNAILIILISASLTLSGYSIKPEENSLVLSESKQTLVSWLWLKEILGAAKRELLVEAITYAIESHVETKEQFETALDEFKSIVEFDGAELEAAYKTLNNEYKKSENQANSFNKHINDVERVSKRLFAEWEKEIEIYEDPNLRQASSLKLATTKAECQRLIAAMRQAESKIDPVLVIFRDRVLFLKHNLNASAIAAIENNLSLIRLEINELATEIQNSVDEADRFINRLND